MREEGHYTIKRVKSLPKQGNQNWLYAITSNSIERFYRWLPNKTYEIITLGAAGVTNTSQLINDGENGIDSFITINDLQQYTLSPISGTNMLSLLKDGSPVSTIDLTPYLDDTNLSRIISGVVVGNILTITRDDASTFDIDVSTLVGGGVPTGLEAINEGNGVGWRLIGRDPVDYANIGLDAVDFSTNTTSYLTKVGSAGAGSITFGDHNENRGASSIANGFNNIISSDVYSWSSFLNGSNNIADGSLGSLTVGTTLINRNAWGCTVLGVANEEIQGSGGVVGGSESDPILIIGNGSQTNDFQSGNFHGYKAVVRSNALVARRGGQIEAPSLTIAKIDAGIDKILVTKEWHNANSDAPTGLIQITVPGGVGVGGPAWRLANNTSSTPALGSIDISNHTGGYGPLGRYSLAFGRFNRAIDDYSVVGGNGVVANERYNVAIGLGLVTSSEAEAAFGRYNLPLSSIDDRRFSIGIGGGPSTEKDGLSVYGTGEVLAPESTIAVIDAADPKILVTKEWAQPKNTYTTLSFLIASNYVDQTSGVLEIGKTYLTDTVSGGDDFTNVGWTADGVEFVATGTTPTTWTNGSYVVNITDSQPTTTILEDGFTGVNFAYIYDYNNGFSITADSPIFLDNKTIINMGNLGNINVVPRGGWRIDDSTLGITGINNGKASFEIKIYN